MMQRTFLAVLAIVVAGVSMAEEESKKPVPKPIGTWTKAVEGGTWTISIEESRIVFHGAGAKPEDSAYTAMAPHYSVSEEGILCGYVRELKSQRGEDSSTSKVVHPFAFRVKVTGETMTISDLTMRSADQRTHSDLTGEFKKVIEKNASAPAKGLKR